MKICSNFIIFRQINNKILMGILDQYKKALDEEDRNMELPESYMNQMSGDERNAYEAELNKLRNAEFSDEEIREAIENSKRNMMELDDEHDGGINEQAMRINIPERLTDEDLMEKGLLKSAHVSDIRVIRAYCPICGRELVSKAPAMYNPFTMEKMCIVECCGKKFNVDKPYPHIGYFDENGEEIVSFGL